MTPTGAALVATASCEHAALLDHPAVDVDTNEYTDDDHGHHNATNHAISETICLLSLYKH